MTPIRIERSGPLLTVVLDNPDRRNAQTPSLWTQLAAVRNQIDSDVRIVAIWGEGQSFSAGMDLRLLSPEGIPGEVSPFHSDHVDPDSFIREAQKAFSWWREVDPITIALVHGHAIGAGFQLALACDLRVVAPDAQFAMRETSLGLVPDLGGTRPLVEAVGYPRALEICATGRFVDADEAMRIGLANAVVPREHWAGWLEKSMAPVLAAHPSAVSALKHLLNGAAGNGDQLDREREAQLLRLAAMMRP
jgi:enoyl-CoA hydratase/carnithine racemase